MRTILTLGTVCLVFTGCASEPDREQASVVTSFYPLAFAAERIGGHCLTVRNLTPPGVEPHDLELTPDGVEAIATADLVVYLGGGFQPAVQDALSEASGRLVDVLAAVPTIAPAAAGEGDLPIDPHVWLDPARFQMVVATLAAALERATEGCDLDDRARRLGEDLAELDAAYRTGLTDCELDVVVTAHAAFGYVADAYGLRQEAISGLEPEAEPDARRLAELEALVEREGVSVVFTEELVAPDVAETLATEAGIDTAVLFTIEGLTDDQVNAGDDYLSLMEDNLDALRSALRCA